MRRRTRRFPNLPGIHTSPLPGPLFPSCFCQPGVTWHGEIPVSNFFQAFLKPCREHGAPWGPLCFTFSPCSFPLPGRGTCCRRTHRWSICNGQAWVSWTADACVGVLAASQISQSSTPLRSRVLFFLHASANPGSHDMARSQFPTSSKPFRSRVENTALLKLGAPLGD